MVSNEFTAGTKCDIFITNSWQILDFFIQKQGTQTNLGQANEWFISRSLLGFAPPSCVDHTQDLEKVHFGNGALNISEHTQDYSTIIGF